MKLQHLVKVTFALVIAAQATLPSLAEDKDSSVLNGTVSPQTTETKAEKHKAHKHAKIVREKAPVFGGYYEPWDRLQPQVH